MLRNPQKRANIKALAAHFHLIEDKATLAAEEGRDIDSDDDSYMNNFPINDDSDDDSGIGFGQDENGHVGDPDSCIDPHDIAQHMVSLKYECIDLNYPMKIF